MVNTLSLPQHTTPDELAARTAQLEERQSRYVYKSPPTIPGVAFIQGPIDKLPDEQPTGFWKLKVALRTALVHLNFSRMTPVDLWRAVREFFHLLTTDTSEQKVVDATLDELKTKNDEAKKKTSDALVTARAHFRDARVKGSTFEERDHRLEVYRDMYKVLPMPYIGNIFLEDRVFSRLRVAGYNPISLFRVDTVDAAPFFVEKGRMPASGDTVAAAAEEKRLYALDFSVMSGVTQKKTRPEQIIVPTKALFAVSPHGTGELQPVGIELPDGVVYPPREDESFSTRWAIAKMIVNNCDAIHHELIAHLGRTHLLVEPFVAATMRQLPPQHPVHALLRPHFEGTIFINDTASRSLVAPGGNVDTVFAGDISAVMKWCAEIVINTPFNDIMPDVEMKRRGVDATQLTSPYREDALEHFQALTEWTRGFLNVYYEGDDELSKDTELQAWVAELVDDDRGRVKGFGDEGDGRVQSLDYLSRALAFIIFSASVQHAAVNFPQQALMSYAPAVAGAMYASPVGRDEECCMETWVDMLTPADVAIDQVEILNVIGAVYYTQLGRYRSSEMPREKAIQEALQTYRTKLSAIDRRIKARESGEKLKYEYLRPCNVPQSINI